MTRRAAIDDFLGQKTLAVAGVSRSGKGFGYMASKELRRKGYRVYVIHPGAAEIDGAPCFPAFAALPERVGGVLVIVPPVETEKVVREALGAGVSRFWLQQGAESERALELCREAGASAIHRECILMYAEPVVSFHKFHRWIWRLLGKAAH